MNPDPVCFQRLDPVQIGSDPQHWDIGKPEIYRRKDQVSRQPISVIFGHLDKKTVGNCNADRYPAYQ